MKRRSRGIKVIGTKRPGTSWICFILTSTVPIAPGEKAKKVKAIDLLINRYA